MSSYTTPMRAIVEHYSQFEDGLNWKERIEIARPKIFNFKYPFFDDSYRKVFETNMIKHFYTREIGFETEGLFFMKLDAWLNVEMVYYNKLFESELLEFDPLTNTKMETTHNKKNDRNENVSRETKADGTSQGTSSSQNKANSTTDDESFNRNIESDTPQNRLELTSNDGEGMVEYATKINEDKNTGNSSSNTNSETDNQSDVSTTNNVNDSSIATTNDMEDFIQNRFGKIGSQSYSSMLNEYRSTLLNIEKQIFNHMEELFMGVY